jgi:hypothetical protein
MLRLQEKPAASVLWVSESVELQQEATDFRIGHATAVQRSDPNPAQLEETVQSIDRATI